MTATDRIIMLIYVCLNIFIALAVRIAPGFGFRLLQEDNFYENLTSLALLFAALYILFRSFQNMGNKKYVYGMIQLVIGFGLIFMAGEEISWGQRIFNWQSTGIFKENNLQGETNFHNLKIGDVKLNKVIFTYAFTAIGAFVFVIAPYLYKKYAGFRIFVNHFGTPLPSYRHTLFLLLGLLFVLLIPDDSKQWELWEFNAAAIIFWMVLKPLNKNIIYHSAENANPSKG